MPMVICIEKTKTPHWQADQTCGGVLNLLETSNECVIALSVDDGPKVFVNIEALLRAIKALDWR